MTSNFVYVPTSLHVIFNLSPIGESKSRGWAGQEEGLEIQP